MNCFELMIDGINNKKEQTRRNIEKKVIEYIKSYIKRRVREYINNKKKSIKRALKKIHPVVVFKNIRKIIFNLWSNKTII